MTITAFYMVPHTTRIFVASVDTTGGPDGMDVRFAELCDEVAFGDSPIMTGEAVVLFGFVAHQVFAAFGAVRAMATGTGKVAH